MPATPEQCRRYRQRLKARAYMALCGLFQVECFDCGATDNLEMAHCRSTELNGAGRGMDRRYLDVIRNPECYRLLCRDCHAILDSRADLPE